MKMIITALMLTISASALALTKYNISKGKFHKSGIIEVVASESEDTAHINIKYNVKAKSFIPGFFKKYLSGTRLEVLPKEFLYEDAYLNLEKGGELEVKDAFVFHQGRIDYGRYTNCHKILIIGKNGKSETIAYYHPLVKDAGWVFISLTLKNMKVIGSYNLKADLAE
jgi:hypothetical protein